MNYKRKELILILPHCALRILYSPSSDSGDCDSMFLLKLTFKTFLFTLEIELIHAWSQPDSKRSSNNCIKGNISWVRKSKCLSEDSTVFLFVCLKQKWSTVCKEQYYRFGYVVNSPLK